MNHPSVGLKLSLIGPKCFGLGQNVFDMAQKAKNRSENKLLVWSKTIWTRPTYFNTSQNYFGNSTYHTVQKRLTHKT